MLLYLSIVRHHNILKKGIKNIPEDRHKRGLVLDYTVAENVVLQNYKKPEFTSLSSYVNSIVSKNQNMQDLIQGLLLTGAVTQFASVLSEIMIYIIIIGLGVILLLSKSLILFYYYSVASSSLLLLLLLLYVQI